jgi:hypothetical protein
MFDTFLVSRRLSPPPSTGGFIPEPHGFGVFLGAGFESFDLMYFRTEVTSREKRSQAPRTQAQL